MTTPSKVYVPEPGTRVRVLEICPSDYSARLQVGDVITVSWSRVGRGSGNGYALVGIDSGELGTWCLVEPAPTSPARCDTICPDGRRCELHGHHDRCMTSTKMTLHGSWAAASPAREDVCDACGATPVTHRDTIAKDFQPTDLTDRYNFCKACSVVHWDKLIPAIRTRRRSLTQPAEEFRVGDECEGNHKGEIRSGILVNFEPLANGIAGAWLTQPGEPTTGLLWGVHRNSLRLIRRASQGFKKGDRVSGVVHGDCMNGRNGQRMEGVFDHIYGEDSAAPGCLAVRVGAADWNALIPETTKLVTPAVDAGGDQPYKPDPVTHPNDRRCPICLGHPDDIGAHEAGGADCVAQKMRYEFYAGERAKSEHRQRRERAYRNRGFVPFDARVGLQSVDAATVREDGPSYVNANWPESSEYDGQV